MVREFDVTSFKGEDIPFVHYFCSFDEFSSLEGVTLVVTNCLSDLAIHNFLRYFWVFRLCQLQGERGLSFTRRQIEFFLS